MALPLRWPQLPSGVAGHLHPRGRVLAIRRPAQGMPFFPCKTEMDGSLSGYVWGGGVEYASTDNVNIRLEGLSYEFEDGTYARKRTRMKR
jgi:opacity protein-like surface antigen